ncbi:Bug family tripartite tricarboxylate transporter substrate binding protein [Roseococcus sp.]|uniref:Bug family tripartite tricarboxylate transporter substrate binding protein n=1 Tax=Roseococcus sp. TaxID=2109646 RepID=UPI003BA960E5
MIAPRRTLLALPMLATARPAFAAPFPERPIRLVVPYAPGGNTDVLARILSQPMSEILGQPVVVENRAGAGGSVASLQIARTRSDGYTLMVGSNGPMTVNPSIQPALGYDPLRDFAPLGLACRTPLTIVVKPGLPVRDLREFIAYAQENRGQVTVGSSGVGSSGHLAIASFAALTGLTLQHVPYPSGAQIVTDLLAGNMDSAITEISTAMPLHRGGQIRILAIATAARSALAPDLPTAEEAGVRGFREAAFIGVVLPANPPPEAQATLAAALAATLARPEVQRRINETGSEVAAEQERTPAGFAAFLATELPRTQAAAVRAGLRPA